MKKTAEEVFTFEDYTHNPDCNYEYIIGKMEEYASQPQGEMSALRELLEVKNAEIVTLRKIAFPKPASPPPKEKFTMQDFETGVRELIKDGQIESSQPQGVDVTISADQMKIIQIPPSQPQGVDELQQAKEEIEIKLLEKLAECFNDFVALEKLHPSDCPEFMFHIHALQHMVLALLLRDEIKLEKKW